MKPRKTLILCIHIKFERKIADLLKIQGLEKKFDK